MPACSHTWSGSTCPGVHVSGSSCPAATIYRSGLERFISKRRHAAWFQARRHRRSGCCDVAVLDAGPQRHRPGGALSAAGESRCKRLSQLRRGAGGLLRACEETVGCRSPTGCIIGSCSWRSIWRAGLGRSVRAGASRLSEHLTLRAAGSGSYTRLCTSSQSLFPAHAGMTPGRGRGDESADACSPHTQG